MKKTLFSGLIMIALLWSACDKDEDSKELKAAFAWELTTDPGKVKFTNQSTNAISYEWYYDDGTSSTMANPTKTYNQNGTYIVTLKAFGSSGTNSVKDTVIVNNITMPN